MCTLLQPIYEGIDYWSFCLFLHSCSSGYYPIVFKLAMTAVSWQAKSARQTTNLELKETSQISTQSLLGDDFAARDLILDLLFCCNLEMLSWSVSNLETSPHLGEVLSNLDEMGVSRYWEREQVWILSCVTVISFIHNQM